MDKKITGKINVTDDVVSYTAELRGEWTIRQIAAAFADGYDTSANSIEGEKIECAIEVADKCIGTFTLTDDGQGGVKKLGEYPHKVKWS